ncbi:hypothetical protein E8E14_000007, partial [Neopestalotiopsis sp. 37M]
TPSSKTPSSKTPSSKTPSSNTTKKTSELSRASSSPRPVPCLGCLKSAMHGQSDGQCWELVKTKLMKADKCERCHKNNHACVPIVNKREVLDMVAKFYQHMNGKPKDKSKYKTTVKALLEMYQPDDKRDKENVVGDEDGKNNKGGNGGKVDKDGNDNNKRMLRSTKKSRD